MNRTVVDDILRSRFLTKDKFVEDIELLVVDNGLNYIDAILHYCDENNIEIELVPKLLNRAIKEKLEYDASLLNFLRNSSRARLPL